jgi:hypothetical protein
VNDCELNELRICIGKILSQSSLGFRVDEMPDERFTGSMSAYLLHPPFVGRNLTERESEILEAAPPDISTRSG